MPGRSESVSIRTRPFGRVMLAVARRSKGLAGVSIRTRPFGRVMLATVEPGLTLTWFQSAPGLSAG